MSMRGGGGRVESSAHVGMMKGLDAMPRSEGDEMPNSGPFRPFRAAHFLPGGSTIPPCPHSLWACPVGFGLDVPPLKYPPLPTSPNWVICCVSPALCYCSEQCPYPTLHSNYLFTFLSSTRISASLLLAEGSAILNIQ